MIVKHATPCGIASSNTALLAYQQAFAADQRSAFGRIIAFNCPLDLDTAQAIVNQQFAELIISPQIHPEALAVFASKPNLRVLTYYSNAPNTNVHPQNHQYTSITGGLLVQSSPALTLNNNHWRLVTQRPLTQQMQSDLVFAWKAVYWVKSNAILCVKNNRSYGIGSGQVSRIDSVRIALQKAKEAGLDINQCVLASDAFFPFRDGIDLAAKAGIAAIIQPGGSKRDTEVIQAANEANIAMVFTGQRLFRH